MDPFALPLHPLIVHAAVVLLPIASLGALLIVVSPKLRERYGLLTTLFGLAAFGSVIGARLTGPLLLERVAITPEVRAHEAWGMLAPWPAAVLAVGLVALAILQRRKAESGPLYWVIAVSTVLGALASLVLIVLVGESGATAVWGNV